MSSIKRYPTVLLRRREDLQAALTSPDAEITFSELEAFLVAQCYGGLSYDKAKDTEFTAVVHDGKVTFLRRVLDVETIPDWGSGGLYFATNGRVPAFLKRIEGRAYPRNLRAVKYVRLCHDTDTDEVWIEDDNGRVC